MELPIRFPSESEVIYEEAMRFRALSPDERASSLQNCLCEYQKLRAISGRLQQMDHFAEEEESQERQAILRFAERHHD